MPASGPPSAQDETAVSDRKGSLVSPTAWHRPSRLRSVLLQGSSASYHGMTSLKSLVDAKTTGRPELDAMFFFSPRYMHDKVEFEH